MIKLWQKTKLHKVKMLALSLYHYNDLSSHGLGMRWWGGGGRSGVSGQRGGGGTRFMSE